MKTGRRTLALAALAALAAPVSGLDAAEGPKRSLAGNMKLTYLVEPPAVETVEGLFREGILYGRLRTNAFSWDWDEEAPGERKDNYSWGIGGSLIYRTAVYRGFSAAAGLYTSHSPFVRMDREDIGFLKSGKDVLSREEVRTEGSYDLTVLGQGWLQYAGHAWRARWGRQLFESVFTASNDTKMIPNTFDGLLVANTSFPDTRIRATWFVEQKLRDHESPHDPITFRDADGNNWGNQDDSAVHKGLSYQNFVAAGEDPDHDLFILDLRNTSVPNLEVTLSGLAVPDVLYDVVAEAHYTIPLGDWTLTPGVRYFRQFDDGGGAVGGASLDGDVDAGNPGGYTDPDSLDGSLLGLRAVLRDREGIYKLLAGYTDVADDADLVTPWRGFPTGGYTRPMGQYNWRADTTSFMFQGFMDLGKADLLPGFRFDVRLARLDFDEGKGFTDRDVLNLNAWQRIPWIAGLEAKGRLVLADDDGETSYNEYRLELNYLF